MIDVLTLGEALVSFRTPTPLAGVWSAQAHVAGAESNVAIGLARLGHRVAWAGSVSDDDLGSWVLGTLSAEGVDVTHARRVPGATAGAMVLVDPADQARRVTYLRRGSAGSRPDLAGARAALDAGVRRVHVTGITPALSAEAARVWVALMTEARRRGVRVSFDVNHRPALWTRDAARRVFADARGLVDVLIASEDELDLVAAGPEEAAVSALLADGVRLVVLTRAERGVTVAGPGVRRDLPAPRVDVVDVIGAGDALCTGLLSGLLDGLAPVDAARRGVAVAARCVATPGDWEGLPTRAELDAP